MTTHSAPRWALLAGTALATLLGAGAAAAQDLEGELSFMVAEYSPKTAPFWQAQVDAFEAAHPGVDVTLEVIGWQAMHDTTVQRIAADDVPDLINTATIWLPEWVEAGALQPITPALVSDALRADFVPALFEKGALYEGEVWGLPIAAAARAMFYNRALFTAAGLDPETPPATWEELKADAIAIHDASGEFGYGFDAKGVQAFRYFGFFLWNNGGDFFDAEGKAAFNSEAGAEALAFLVDLAGTGATPDPVGTALEDLQPLFESGRLGMLIDGNFLVPRLIANAPDLDYGAALVPVSGLDVPPVTWGVTDTLVIGKDADPAIAKAFIDSIYQTAVRTEFDVNEGLLPVLESQADDPAFTGDPVTAAFVAMMPTARFDPLHPNYSQMQELVKTAIQQALGGTDPKAALDEAAEAFDALVEE